MIGVKSKIRHADTSELTTNMKEWTILAKSLLPLPDKCKGLTDASEIHMHMNLDFIVTPNVKSAFIKRSKATSSTRTL